MAGMDFVDDMEETQPVFTSSRGFSNFEFPAAGGPIPALPSIRDCSIPSLPQNLSLWTFQKFLLLIKFPKAA